MIGIFSPRKISENISVQSRDKFRWTGNPANGIVYMLGNSSTAFNLGSVFTSWVTGAPLEVTLAYYNEGQYGSLYLVNLHDNVGSVYSCDMRYGINVSLCKK